MFGSLLWQLGLCRAAQLEVPIVDLHTVLLTLVVLIVVMVFVCVPGFAGPGSLQIILVPMLGALLLAVALSSLVRPNHTFGFSLQELLREEPCNASAGTSESSGDFEPSLQTLAAWLCLAACGIALQIFLTMNKGGKENPTLQGSRQGDLVAALLPGVRGESGGGAGLPRPGEGGNERYAMLTKAMFAAEDADMSHLTESEKKLVEVCRKDSFERDRILWGGGLI